ncbi:alpha/beta hydrolase [Nonomuraea sp. KC401]|uniref:Alpha/beta hydrolase n=1 Tax=Nonomuraea longispora TaxID=1848320 RepID=A0A4R4NHR7_9ACTN|nr:MULTISPECIES: alpha/beta hydrolase [Nonomuraea]NBE96553.1 alpha/beta fold hydrolase [Nonomuraea sp. K271]TDC07150.1 alpha/beta hydrolase [Nonomuraea longispora]TLF86345.1 alpha/beta hydrolase [Nonomuraea sp. KC401]
MRVSSGHTSIDVERAGTGPAILLVHGTGDDKTCWRSVVPPLSVRHSVHTMDRRGRGGSGDAAGHSIRAEADDIVAVLDHIGPATLVGHSFGAICALEAASRAPSSVEGLVLYEPPVPVPGTPDFSGVAARVADLCAQDRREEALCLFLVEVTGLEPGLAKLLRRVPGFAERAAVADTIAREIDATHHYVLDRERLATLTVPTLLLKGDRSAPGLHEAVAMIAGLMPRAVTEVLPGQAHRAMEGAPAMLADAVDTFAGRYSHEAHIR